MQPAAPRRRVEPLDAVVVLALTLATQVEVWAPQLALATGEVTGNRQVLAATGLVMTLPLAVRRAYPLLPCVAGLAAAAAQQLLTVPTEGLSTLAALLLAAYSVSAYGSRTVAVAGGAVITAGSPFIGEDWSDHAFVLVLLGAAWAMGLAVGRRTTAVTVLQGHNLELEQQRREAADRGAAEERARIAREMHDIVAHRVSMMVVQTQAADALLDERPEAARQAIQAVEETGREALAELRALLGLLRSQAPAAAPGTRTPQPGLGEITELVEASRTAGLPVELHSHGNAVPVPPAVAMAAYRIVQEAITNVVKHAGSAPTTVTLHFRGDALDITVADAGTSSGVDGTPGYGLAGMKERVAFVGGSMSFGRRTAGGYSVRATLPITDQTA